MTRSVISRRALPGGTPSYWPRTSIGSPNVTVTRTSRGRFGADRLEPVGAEQPDRDDRGARGERELGDAGPAAVEPTVARSRALRVDAERTALGEHAQRRVEAGQRGLGVVAVDRQRAEASRTTP